MDFNLDELMLIRYALKNCSDIEVPMDLLNAIDSAMERMELEGEMFDDCESCKL